MKVYLVMYSDYGSWTIEGVFADEDAAEAHRKQMEGRPRDGYEVIELRTVEWDEEIEYADILTMYPTEDKRKGEAIVKVRRMSSLNPDWPPPECEVVREGDWVSVEGTDHDAVRAAWEAETNQ